MRVFLIVNPAASSVTPRSRAAVEECLRREFDLSVVETTQRGHARDLARDALDAGGHPAEPLAERVVHRGDPIAQCHLRSELDIEVQDAALRRPQPAAAARQ